MFVQCEIGLEPEVTFFGESDPGIKTSFIVVIALQTGKVTFWRTKKFASVLQTEECNNFCFFVALGLFRFFLVLKGVNHSKLYKVQVPYYFLFTKFKVTL